MARLKNAERQHYVQAYVPGTEEPGTEWLELASTFQLSGMTRKREPKKKG